MSDKVTYQDSGVSINDGNELVERIKKMTRAQKHPQLISGIGGFAGLFGIPPEMKEPVLVSSTDGVGTKLKLAFESGRHDTIGQDLVAMSVNDILVCGARPLFFLDYFATGKLDIDVAETVVRGIHNACAKCNVVLLGGETAEMPGLYSEGEYDLAGFAVGIVERSKILDLSKICEGDFVVALPSSGLHSNGFSLARKVILEVQGLGINETFPGTDQTVADVMLEPTRLYVSSILHLLEKDLIKSMVHVTGGGLVDNPPRSLPEGFGMDLDTESWDEPVVFKQIRKSVVDEYEMRRTFNMGLGFLMVVGKDDVNSIIKILGEIGEKCMVVGKVSRREGKSRETRFSK
jgi:phosphoribosylformylglycinamidine cyclo-ligase